VNSKLTIVLAVILVCTSFVATPMLLLQRQSASAAGAATRVQEFNGGTQSTTSGNNVYLVWFSNKTGNWEVLFRASTDGGKTFSDKMNLSNTTNADSTDPQVVANGNNVIVTWWERTDKSNDPVARISTDNGKTFGPILKLATNGTISSTE
jgi:hypothetical protein